MAAHADTYTYSLGTALKEPQTTSDEVVMSMASGLGNSPKHPANPRKRPRNGDATVLSEDGGDVDDGSSRSPKRSRGSSKPMTDEISARQWKATRRRKSKTTSPRPARYSDQTPRPSKFAEGSMNDKPSKRPPSLYTREEEAMEEYMTEPAATQRSSVRPSQDLNLTYDAGIDQGKPSAMYRFGKAMASVFNPVSSLFKAKEPHVDPQQSVLQERQAKAKEAYAELKRSGFTGTRLAQSTPSADAGPMQGDAGPPSSQTASFRDSAIDIEEYRPPVDKEDQRTDVMPAPIVPLVQRSVSPMPRVSSRRSSLNLHTPALTTLKRVGSHLQLPSAKRHSAQESRLSTDSVDTGADGQQVRKQPSKKDLSKQKRLYKRVSNLESQLDDARRELAELETIQGTKHNNVHVSSSSRHKAFVPGALPSLPSERMLKDHVAHNEEEPPAPKLQSRYSVDRRDHPIVPVLFPNLPSAQKRSNPQATEFADQNAAKASRKEPTSDKATSNPQPGHETPNQATRQISSSRKRMTVTAPPVPPLPATFHPSQVDKAKIMLMRDNVDYHLPFGQSASDATNLRKAYPTITDAQLDELLGKRPQDPKTTEITSTTHLNHIPPPNLGPPRSPSPAADGRFKPSISRASLRSRSHKVPNNSPISVRKTRQDEFAEIERQAAQTTTLDEEKDVVAPLLNPSSEGKDLPAYPKNPSLTVPSLAKEKGVSGGTLTGLEGDEQARGAVAKDKPLPGIQKEDYQWDADVF